MLMSFEKRFILRFIHLHVAGLPAALVPQSYFDNTLFERVCIRLSLRCHNHVMTPVLCTVLCMNALKERHSLDVFTSRVNSELNRSVCS